MENVQLIRYKVTGSGAFPIDHLRLTNSMPADEETSQSIGVSIKSPCAANGWTYTLRGTRPSYAIWAVAGFEVGSIDERQDPLNHPTKPYAA